MKILVAEDDPVSSRLLTKKLRQLGHEVRAADNGAAAWECIQIEAFPVVITDWMMPIYDGLELCRRIRSLVDREYCHVIMLTCKNSREERLQALGSGVDDFLPKPVDMEELAARLQIAERMLEIQYQLAAKNKELRGLVAAISESEARFRALIENMTDIILVLEADATVRYVSPSVERVLGYTPATLVRQDVLTQVHPDDLEITREIFAALVSKPGIVVPFEARLRHKDGSWRDLEAIGSNLRSQAGGEEVLVNCRDITERRQAEDELWRAHAETEQMLSAISSILIGVDSNATVTRWNAMAERYLGIPAREVIGRSFTECGIKWDWPTVQERMAECLRADHQTRPDYVRYVSPEGKEGFLALTVNPYKMDGHGQPGLLILGADITERKQLESQLTQAQKLESIGQLAAGIAHEINTPIQYVGDNTRFLDSAFQDLQKLLDKYATLLAATKNGAASPTIVTGIEQSMQEADLEYLREEIPKAIQQSLEGIGRVATIVRAMKDFSHPGSKEMEATDLNKAIASTLTVARNEWKYVAETVTNFDEQLPIVACFAGDFNQAILNIIINAAHAIAEVTENGRAGKGTITVSTQRDGDWAEIRISDTGTGIPESIRCKIFDPFFTTKEVGRGTGQGLAIAHSVVVQKHGGAIDFETEMGKGTTFRIRLPIARNEAA